MSYFVPQWVSFAPALCCRGKEKEQDNDRLTSTTVEFAKIYEAHH